MNKRVWIAQCLCPQRHAIMATAGEAENEPEAQEAILKPLRQHLASAVIVGAINPHCGLCNAQIETWNYEVARTRFRTLKEAEPELRKAEGEQVVMAAIFGDMKRSD